MTLRSPAPADSPRREAGATQPRISVIVPTYNERDNLAPLVERVFAALDPREAEILVIDDDSPDGTLEEARRLAARWPVRCRVRIGERGLARAVVEAMHYAQGQILVVMDADLSHPPERIPDLVNALCAPMPASGARVDMVIGSRFVAGGSVDLHWPLHRRLNSRLGRLLARPLTRVRDVMSGFFCVRAEDVRLADVNPIGYKIALELIVRHAWTNVVEIPISFRDRQHGRTKLNVAEQLRYLAHLARLYTHVALRRWSP